MVNYVKNHSNSAMAIANRRFTSVLALTLKSGMELEKGLELAGELVDNQKVAGQIKKCGEALETGASYYQAMKDTGLFNGFYVQMIKVGSRSGRLEMCIRDRV